MSKPRQQGPHGTPEYIGFLSSEDRKLYEELQQNVGSPDYRYNRNRRLASLRDILEYIRDYCERDEIDSWKRYLVCGICWFEDYIAINTRQLRLLISKSKSAINGGFAKMGYITIPAKGEELSLLLEAIPFLSGHYSEIRQWTIRKMNTSLDSDQIGIKRNEKQKEKNFGKENEKSKEIEYEMKSRHIEDEDFGFYEEPFKAYDWSDDFENEKPEKDINFYSFNSNNDPFYDFNFDYNPSVFTLTVNPYSNDEYPNIYDIKRDMKNSEFISSSREDYSKGF